MKSRNVWLVIVLLCAFGLVARAEIAVTTADGDGADTYLTNDGQEASDTEHGTDVRIRAFRQLVNTRSKTGFIRFDLSGVDGDPNSAFMTFALTYQKGGEKAVDVYGLKDGAGDFWNEATVNYDNAPGVLPATLGNYDLDESMVELLGTLTTPGVPEPNQFSTNTAALPLENFLKMDTNGMVTFIFIGADNENEIASKERTDGLIPPTLTLPHMTAVSRAFNPSPANLIKVLTTEYSELSWTNPDPNLAGGEITCDVYFSDTEPNTLLPNLGMTLLTAGLDGNSVAMPTLDVYKDYYWRVDVHDTSRIPELVKGKVWTFNTNNSAPDVDAGPDQYVWLTGGTVVDTGSSNDVYMRDNTDRGGMEYMDIRNLTTSQFGGYLQFDLSELSALPADSVLNATLTLTKVAGSRDDGITTDRFSLQGLNNVAGNTPQNWDEHALNTDTVGDEWTFPLDLVGGRLTDLDGDQAGISEVISGTAAGSSITVTGAALDAFLQSRVDDDGLVTFVITCEIAGKGYGIASKENSNAAYRPRLQLNYGMANVDVTLSGSYTDDGLPSATETVLWTEVSRPEGAEAVVIDPADVLETTVNLTVNGFYEFQLASDDGDLVGTDTVQVYVGVDPCDASQNMPTYVANIADFNADCFVDLEDVAEFAQQWLDCTSLQCP